MRESIDEWAYVIAAYVVGLGAIMVMLVWNWLAMRRAEKRRDRSREK